MSVLTVEDLILDPEQYAAVRPARRSDAIVARRARRVPVGDVVVLEFENADTLRYQAQEMLFVERVTDPTAAAAEISSYERLLPTARSIAATMMLGITDQDQVRSELSRLDGIHEAVQLTVGPHTILGHDVPPPDEGFSAHTVSVHFINFEIPGEILVLMRGGAPTSLGIGHPEYTATTPLPAELVADLVADMAGNGAHF